MQRNTKRSRAQDSEYSRVVVMGQDEQSPGIKAKDGGGCELRCLQMVDVPKDEGKGKGFFEREERLICQLGSFANGMSTHRLFN